ncbi:MAG: hypothetical protein LBE12_10635 [Planctomycetaceae bacterium]|nr:hypothetical protein [Planctomycetaceae bacterium]
MSQAIYNHSGNKSACELSTIHSQLSTIISPLQGFGKWESSCSGGCASLHRRLCISHP